MQTKLEYIVRELEPWDYDRWSELEALYDPEPSDPNHLRKRREEWDWNNPRIDLTAATLDGRPIGFIVMLHRAQHAEGAFYMNLDVDPEFRGRGIGRDLLGRAEEYAFANGGNIFTTFVRDGDERSKRFAELNGYPHERDLFESTLDVDAFDWAPFESMKFQNRSDLEVVSWREVGDTPENRRHLYEVATGSDTAPDMEIWGIPSQDQFEKDHYGSPWFTPDCTLIAVCDGKWAGVHFSGPLEPGSSEWTTDFTGVLPNFRGQGIGLSLKLRSIEIAKSLGAKRIITHNDSENRPMLAINERLGFVRQPGWLQMRKRI